MATTIQIIVAGVLLLAWIWVLGRPLVTTPARSRQSGASGHYRDHLLPPADLSPDGSNLLDFEPSWGRRVLEAVKAWVRRPSDVWRRQLLLATMFATFASFLLAIALRNVFVELFGLMLSGLVFHLLLAVLVGNRLLAANRAAAVAVAKRSVPAPGMSIRAAQVGSPATVAPVRVTLEDDERDVHDGRLPATDVDVVEEDRPVAEAEDDVDGERRTEAESEADIADESEADTDTDDDPLGESGAVAPDPAESAFDLAAEMASGLDEGGPPAVDEAAVVSDLIESEWGDADGNEHRDEAEDRPEGDGGPSDAAAENTPEPIFRRAAKDEPSRQRRSAKSIEIESQPGDDDGFSEPKAVNHP